MRHFVRSAAALLVLAALLALAGCNDSPPPRGTAAEKAADANARASANASAADKAKVDAAEAKGRAAELARQAKEKPTEDAIAKAANARVDAAAKQAVADALEQTAKDAAAAAEKADEQARKEREEAQKAEDLRSWVFLCRCVGLAGVGLGSIIGCVLGYVAGPRIGVLVGGVIAGTGLLVVEFGQTVTWLPGALCAVVVGGIGVWAIVHARTKAVGTALSQTVDAIEGKSETTVADAKATLTAAIAKAGLGKHFEKARARWAKAPAAPKPPAA